MEASAIGIFRTPEANAFSIPHVYVHRLSAQKAARTAFNVGLMGIVGNELTGADLTDIAPFARGGLTEVIPCTGTATGHLMLDSASIRRFFY